MVVTRLAVATAEVVLAASVGVLIVPSEVAEVVAPLEVAEAMAPSLVAEAAEVAVPSVVTTLQKVIVQGGNKVQRLFSRTTEALWQRFVVVS